MQPLNYLRQAAPALMAGYMKHYAVEHPLDVNRCGWILEMAHRAQKFVLPPGGRVFNDGLKGLPESLHLPYPAVLIEYPSSGRSDGAVEEVFSSAVSAPKRIVLAVQKGEAIDVFSLIYASNEEMSGWAMMPYWARVTRGVRGTTPPEVEAGMVSGELMDDLEMQCFPTGTFAPQRIGPTWNRNAYYDMLDEVACVLELIEALSCSNVEHEPLPVRKMNKGAAKRGALPFDEYRALVVKAAQGDGEAHAGGSHRSPREHLRRGHIRRYQDGKKIWINACVVNAGVAGKINKIYEVK